MKGRPGGRGSHATQPFTRQTAFKAKETCNLNKFNLNVSISFLPFAFQIQVFQAYKKVNKKELTNQQFLGQRNMHFKQIQPCLLFKTSPFLFAYPFKPRFYSCFSRNELTNQQFRICNCKQGLQHTICTFDSIQNRFFRIFVLNEKDNFGKNVFNKRNVQRLSVNFFFFLDYFELYFKERKAQI